MNSPSSANISSGEANCLGSDIQGPLLPQDRNPSEMDTIEELRKKLQMLEEKNLELTTQHKHNMSRYEKEIMKLSLELQRGEALLLVLESETSFARKDAHVQMYSAEGELCDAKAKLMELQARGRGPRHQRFRYASESQLDQSQSQDFREVLPESDLSIEAMRGRPASRLNFPFESFSLEPEVVSPPAPDVRWEPRYRSYTVSGSDIPSGTAFYTTCSSSPGVRWEPRYRSYTVSGSDIPSGGMTPPTSGGALQGTYSMYGSDVTSDSLPSYFVPRGVSTPFAPDASGRDQHFSYGSDSQFDQSYSQHFGPLRPPTNDLSDLMHYRSDTDLYSFWIPFKFSLTSIPLPSGRSGKAYSVLQPTNTYVNVMPSIIHSLSDLDFSSRIQPLSTFSMSVPSSPSMSVPRRETGAGPGSSVNRSFHLRQRRASSWPPIRTVNQGISSNIRRHHEI